MKAAVDEKGYATATTGKSVTALEIEYGVLSSKEQKNRSFFYFRTIDNYSEMPLAVRAVYSELHAAVVGNKHLADAEKEELSNLFAARDSNTLSEAGKLRLKELVAKAPDVETRWRLLNGLKARIESDPQLKAHVRHYHARWNKTSGKIEISAQWANQISSDLWREIEEETTARRTTIDQSWQGQERRALEEFVELRSRYFVGREQLLDELKQFIFSAKGSDVWGLCLHGSPGSGKSAVFAVVYRALQKEQEGGRCLVLANSAGISLRSGNVDAMIRRWIQDIARFFGMKSDDPSKEVESWDDRLKLFHDLLSQASVKTRVVVLVDALNQFERSVMARHLTWLPESWPANARLVATAITGEETEHAGRRRGIALRELPALDTNSAIAVIASLCARFHKTLHRDVIAQLTGKKTPDGAPACANPLWLTMAVTQLNLLDEDDFAAMEKAVGTPEERLHNLLVATAAAFPATVPELYAALYARAHEWFGMRFGIGWIPDMLGLLACSRYGLRERDLEAIIGKMAAEKQGCAYDATFAAEFDVAFALQFAAVRRYLSAHLIQRDELGLWDFMHAQGRMAAQRLVKEEKPVHRLIANHLESLERGDGLRVRELMWHYVKGDMKKEAGEYYGREWWNLGPGELEAATRVLAEVIAVEGGKSENPEENAGLQCIEEMVKSADDNGKKWICLYANLSILPAMVNTTRLPVRRYLIEYALGVQEELSRKNPDDAQAARDVAGSCNNLGNLHIQLGNPAEALKLLKRSLEIREELFRKNPDDAQAARDVVVSYSNLASFYQNQNDQSGVIKNLRLCRDAIVNMKQRNMFVDEQIENVYQQIKDL